MATISLNPLPSVEDWNTGSVWVGGKIPTAADSVILPPPTAADSNTVVIAGGSSDAVTNLTVEENLFVGSVPVFTGSVTGTGTLVASGTITDDNALLVGTAGSTITATGGIFTTSTYAAMGGGGTFNGPIFNVGVLSADGGDYGLGTLILNGSTIASPNVGTIAGSGSIEVYAGSTLELNAPTAETIHIVDSAKPEPHQGTATLTLDQPDTFKGRLSITAGDTLNLFLKAGQTITGSASITGTTLTVPTSLGVETFSLGATGYGGSVISAGGGTGRAELTVTAAAAPVCFARGTRIATPDGAIAVEDLTPGVMVQTLSGIARPVRWVGHQQVDCRRYPDPDAARPIRIRAGAFAPAVPARDLYVSPQHAIYADGVLIPAKRLVNGRSVVQVEVAEIEYFHVELDRHDILLAEGLPTESYLDAGDRAFFANGGSPSIPPAPEHARMVWAALGCAELVVVGEHVTRVRALLAARAVDPEPLRLAS